MSQSYDESPYINRKFKKGKMTTQRFHQIAITQRLRINLTQ